MLSNELRAAFEVQWVNNVLQSLLFVTLNGPDLDTLHLAEPTGKTV